MYSTEVIVKSRYQKTVVEVDVMMLYAFCALELQNLLRIDIRVWQKNISCYTF